MNINKVKINQASINRLLMLFIFMFSLNVFAETAPFRVFETTSLAIKLSNDGTGIIKDIKCNSCDFNFLRITHNSKVSIEGVEVNILEARKHAGKGCMVSFNPETQEVQYIRW